MLGERPVAEYGIALAAIGALIFVVRAILNYLTFVHNNPQKEPQVNNFTSFKDRFVVGAKQIEHIGEQIDKIVTIWNPDRARQSDEIHDYTKKTWNIHDVYDTTQRPVWWMPAKIGETMEKIERSMGDLLKESKRTNILLEKFIALNTQEHNIIIRDIRANSNLFIKGKS